MEYVNELRKASGKILGINGIIHAVILFLAAVSVCGCRDIREDEITHIPFKEDDDDRWGIIDLEGNVLIENEFEGKPSAVRNGVFFVKNEENLYELYTAEKKFKKVGKEYKYVRLFNNGLAPVVEPKQHIEYINPNGETVFVLEKYKDKEITAASGFYEGKAIIMTEDNKYGYINKKGDIIISPVYDSASLFYNGCAYVTDGDKKMFIDEKNKVLIDFGKKYAPVSLPSEGLFCYANIKHVDGDSDMPYIDYYHFDSYGIRNMENKDLIESDSKYNRFYSFVDGYAAFLNKNNDYGLIDKKGEIVIRAKYQNMFLCKDVIVYEDKEKFGLLSYSDEVVLAPKYNMIYPFYGDNGCTYALDDDEYVIINKKGEEVSNKTFSEIEGSSIIYSLFSGVYNMSPDWYMVYSDYVDIGSEASKVTSLITDEGIDVVSYKVKPADFARKYNKDYQVSDLKWKSEMTAQLNGSKNLDMELTVSYNDYVIEPNYERVWHDSYWGGGYYTTELSGYSYKDIEGSSLSLKVSLKDRLYDKSDDFVKAIVKNFEGSGYKEADSSYDNNIVLEKDASGLKVYIENKQYEPVVYIVVASVDFAACGGDKTTDTTTTDEEWTAPPAEEAL